IKDWDRVVFIHGVLNTDNMNISGETIDYVHCAFMDSYDPDTVFSSIDRHGRSAFAHQASIAGWKIERVAQSLVKLITAD
ncbi:protein adenylyltransferase SelO family protein, partial [Francisella tularensis]|uniref:protein adenylyltransferase SelO family protein n=1 Tax=Francisella tularensis TaxID=263 RepID=UPI002381A292